MSIEHYFSVREVEGLIPDLEEILLRLLQLHAQIKATGEALQQLGHPPSDELLAEKPGLRGPLPVRRLQARFRAIYEQVGSDLREVEQLGGAVKDLETGLVDFPARRAGGKEVMLCWRMGEKRVRFFHDLASGYAGRQAIDGDDFASQPGHAIH